MKENKILILEISSFSFTGSSYPNFSEWAFFFLNWTYEVGQKVHTKVHKNLVGTFVWSKQVLNLLENGKLDFKIK